MEICISASIFLVIIATSCLLQAGAYTLNDFLMGSATTSMKNGVPPANTNDSIQYRLYTRSNPKEACFIEPTPDEFDCCPFDPDLETKILIHGFIVTLETEDSPLIIKDALLEHDSFNVICVDWSRHNGQPYTQAKDNTVAVGEAVAKLIEFIKKHTGADIGSFHVVGHSLGAHISGIVGKNVPNLPRITGLDPAGPLYELEDKKVQLCNTDAKFVDVIHTSDEKTGVGLGTYEALGDLDFYPNGGHLQQAACGNASQEDGPGGVASALESPYYFITCNHFMAYKFFLYSINDCDYQGTKCDDYETLSACSLQGNEKARMGYFAKPMKGVPAKTKFYLETSGKMPYCLKMKQSAHSTCNS